MKVTLPYLKVVSTEQNLAPTRLNQPLQEALDLSRRTPCFIEVTGEDEQWYLFFREKQIYSAGRYQDGQFSDVTIKDFLVAASQMRPLAITLCELNSKILHSLLILFQKKAALKLLTSLVDLDQVFDRIEEEGKSCIVCASQDSFLALLRYEKGEVTALCHEKSLPTPKEATFREDFLIKIYTLSAEKPLEISIYEDLLVKYAADAKMIEEGYNGEITDLYLSKPPVITLEFKGKEMGHWVLDRPVLNIGRTADNDIPIDNLAVSRLHAVLERDKGHYYIRDCDSLNGTLLNKRRVGRAKIQPGDEIMIGKHVLRVQKQAGMELPKPVDDAPFDRTVIINPGQIPQALQANKKSQQKTPARLVERRQEGDVIIELSKSSLVLGKDDTADIEIDGLFVADRHAEIVQENGNYVIRHLKGYRKVCVGGRSIRECVLKDNDEIKIGKREFVFQA